MLIKYVVSRSQNHHLEDWGQEISVLSEIAANCKFLRSQITKYWLKVDGYIFPTKILASIISVEEMHSGKIAGWGGLPGEDFKGVFLLKHLLSFRKCSPRKQILLFHWPFRNSTSKCPEHPPEKLLPWCLLSGHWLPPTDSHYFACSSSSKLHGWNNLPYFTILKRSVSRTCFYSFKISISTFPCFYLQLFKQYNFYAHFAESSSIFLPSNLPNEPVEVSQCWLLSLLLSVSHFQWMHE